jgi:hypothetical protein
MMPRLRSNNPWQIAWQFFSSDYLLGFVLLALALALLLAAWMPQTTLAGKDVDLVWQGEMQRRFGDVGWFRALRDPLEALGGFHVTDAPGFRILLALLATALFVRLVDQAASFWHAWQPFGSQAPADAEDAPAAPTATSQGVWPPLGMMAVYLGGLVILLGAAISNVWGWQVGPLPLAPGQRAALERDDDLSVALVSLSEDGQRGTAEIWRGAENLVTAGDLAVGRPLAGDGVGAYLVGSGLGLHVEARSTEAGALALETGPSRTAQDALTVMFTPETPRHVISVRGAQLVLLLEIPESNQGDARPRIQVFRAGSGEFLLEQDVPEERVFILDDVTLSLAPITYAQVRVIRDKGAFWSQVGAIVLAVGLLTYALGPWVYRWLGRRARADLSPDQERLEPEPATGQSRAG